MKKLLYMLLVILPFLAVSQSNTDNSVTRYLREQGDVLFSPNDSLLAINNGDGKVSVWDIYSDKLIFSDSFSALHGAMFSPDNKRILFHFIDSIFYLYNIYKIYDAKTGKYISNIKFDKESDTTKFYKSCINQDWKKIVTVDLNKNAIYIWDLTDSVLKLNKLLILPGQEINEIGISPDSKYIFSFSIDRWVKVWDINTAELVSSFKINCTFYQIGDYDTINKKLIILHDFARWSERGIPHIYDIISGKDTYSLGLSEWERTLKIKFTDDGKFIYAHVFNEGVSSLRIWNAETGQITNQLLDDSVHFFDISSKGGLIYNSVYSNSMKQYLLIILDLKTFKVLNKLINMNMVETGISSDGNMFIGGYMSEQDKHVLLINAKDGSILKRFQNVVFY